MHPVGGVPGLLIQVTPSGSKSWLLRTLIGGRRRHIGLGPYPAVSLADARRKAQEARDTISLGVNPIDSRKEARKALLEVQRTTVTFAEAADRFIAIKEKEFRNARQSKQWRSSLETYANPHMGTVPVRAITREDILAVLRPIWEEKTETATRVRARMENILDRCAREGYRDGTNPASWKESLRGALPEAGRIRTRRHFRALPVREVPAFVAKLRDRKGEAAPALEFMLLTAARSSEVIGDKRLGKLGVTWKELDLEEKLWRIPAEKMKSGKAHTVPLPPRALEIIGAAQRGHEAVFTQRGEIPSDNFLRSLVKRMGYDFDPHGLRSSFKDWAREHTTYADEVSELALAHVNSDATRAAYARSELVEKRRELMIDWQRYCDAVTSAGKDSAADE
nr:site-specific integrase [Chromatocurvus halotolerans]